MIFVKSLALLLGRGIFVVRMRAVRCRERIATARGMLRNGHFVCAAACMTAFLCLFLGTAQAQEARKPPIAQSSNLSAALNAAEWKRVESSIDRGLEWLATQQEKDGRFTGEESIQPAVTSLAVMAFLSRGYVPDQGRYGVQLSRAIDFVLSTQRQLGEFSLLRVEPPDDHLMPGQTSNYNHSIAGLMLGEVYGMTSGARSIKIEAALNRALVYHRDMQIRQKGSPRDTGGWRYAFPDAPHSMSDLSVTGWALMFLRSARNAEFNVPKEYFDEGLDFVERCYERNPANHQKGVFGYRPGGAPDHPPDQITHANTASAILALMLGGRQEKESVAVGVRWFTSREYPRPWQSSYWYLSTYYSSQAMAQAGGDAWNQVFPQIVHNLLEGQTANGSWPILSEPRIGETCTTSLAILSLTPPYQLLPIYQR